MTFKVTKINPFGVLIQSVNKNCSIYEIEIAELENYFKEEQLILLRGFKTFQTADEFSSFCELWGKISVWPFGKVLELKEQEEPIDHIFDHSYVPLHWDGMYRPEIPEYQIFHCVNAPSLGQGGRTTFSNTILTLKNADPEIIRLWSHVTGRYQREMEFYKSETISPVITQHPYRDCFVIRYNEPPNEELGKFINPPFLEFIGLPEQEINYFHESLIKALYAPTNYYAHEWNNGDIVIADNFSLLHGRESFVKNASRHLQRVHVLSKTPFKNPGLKSYQ